MKPNNQNKINQLSNPVQRLDAIKNLLEADQSAMGIKQELDGKRMASQLSAPKHKKLNNFKDG